MRAKRILKEQIAAFKEEVRRHDMALEMIAEINERLAELRRMLLLGVRPAPWSAAAKAKAAGVLNEAVIEAETRRLLFGEGVEPVRWRKPKTVHKRLGDALRRRK